MNLPAPWPWTPWSPVPEFFIELETSSVLNGSGLTLLCALGGLSFPLHEMNSGQRLPVRGILEEHRLKGWGSWGQPGAAGGSWGQTLVQSVTMQLGQVTLHVFLHT